MTAPELRAAIIDDEEPAREVLRELLEAHSNVRVIGEADSVANAAILCRDLNPNLLFLDVQMDDGEGFDLLPKIDSLPAIIFVTAYERFAIRAFEVNAVDYLLKPVDPQRLAHTLQRIVRQPQSAAAQRLGEDDRIHLRGDRKQRFAFLAEISGIEALENYSIVRFLDGDSLTMRRSMTEWEEFLPTRMFCRPHRSFIINVDAVRMISRIGKNEVHVKIQGFSKPVQLGRRAAAKFQSSLRQPNLL
ncbi:MAG: response regulator transcription factor [Chthoniobacterales bacterium]|nr:response regulator transcription factor [Chthoniobacterales bacterium]